MPAHILRVACHYETVAELAMEAAARETPLPALIEVGAASWLR